MSSIRPYSHPFRRLSSVLSLALCLVLSAASAGCMTTGASRLELASPSSGDGGYAGMPMALAGQDADAGVAYATTAGRADSAGTGVPAVLDRKVIKSASVDVQVEDRAVAATSLASHAAVVGGFVLSSREGKTRTWITLRVPAAAFEETLSRVEGAGRVTGRSVQGQDVTEEYLDLEARIENAHKLRIRLTALLDRATRIEEMLQIEHELSRVQQQIEQMEGRLRYLSHRVDLSTIEVTLSEVGSQGWPGPVTLVLRGGWWVVRSLFWIEKPDLTSMKE